MVWRDTVNSLLTHYAPAMPKVRMPTKFQSAARALGSVEVENFFRFEARTLDAIMKFFLELQISEVGNNTACVAAVS